MVRQVRALATSQPERTHSRKEPIPESCLLTSMSINACLHACINVKKNRRKPTKDKLGDPVVTHCLY